MMKIIKRDLFLFVAITAFVVVVALLMGHPFFGTSTGPGIRFVHAQEEHWSLFRGAVLRDSEHLLFRRSSGELLRFNTTQQAAPYEEQTVMIFQTCCIKPAA